MLLPAIVRHSDLCFLAARQGPLAANMARRALRTLAAAHPAKALKVACVSFAAIVTALWFRSALLESAQLCVQQQACLANVAAYSIAMLHEP